MTRNSIRRVSVIRRLPYGFVYCLTDMSFSQEQRVAPAFALSVAPRFFPSGGALKEMSIKQSAYTRGTKEQH
jgi:hypothetical protein